MNAAIRSIAVVFLVSGAISARAETPRTTGVAFDGGGSLYIEAEIPEGYRRAVLEISDDLSAEAVWRPMIAGEMDGRKSTVSFWLPPQGGDRCFARIRTLPGTTGPGVELDGPDLFGISYGEAVAEEVKVGFLTEGGGRMRGWAGLPRAEAKANLMSWAGSHPAVESVHAVSGTDDVTVHFTDGTSAVFFKDSKVERAGPGPARGIAAGSGEVAGVVPRMQEEQGGLPGTRRAVTAFSLESFFPDLTQRAKDWLDFRGYRTTRYGDATLDHVMDWAARDEAIALLVWQAHGAKYRKRDGREGVAIVTRGRIQADGTDPMTGHLFRLGQIIYAQDSEALPPLRAVTGRFVRATMVFAPRSVVILDVCMGGDPEISQAFIDSGAGSVAGWDGLSGRQSIRPCLQVLDRLLGMNAQAPVSTPSERPFPLSVVSAWMTQRGHRVDPSPKFDPPNDVNSNLVWMHSGRGPADILMPSISRVDVERPRAGEHFSQYFLTGAFGPAPPAGGCRVTWGDEELEIVRWTAQHGITVKVPAVPPSGGIRVHRGTGYEISSNSVPMTEWRIPFRHTLADGGALRVVADLNVTVRGDVRGTRAGPEQPVVYHPVRFQGMADGHGRVTASGSHEPYAGTSVVWSGGSNLASRDPEEGPMLPGGMLLDGVLTPQTGVVQDFRVAAHGAFTQTIRIDGGPTYGGEVDHFIDARYFFHDIPPRFDAIAGAWLGGSRSQGAELTLTWPQVTPFHFPTAATPR